MAITSYSELQTAVANWLNREDLTARIPEFIALAEATFNRNFRVMDMITRETLALDNDTATSVAADWLETHSLMLNYSPPINLEYVRPHDMHGVQTTERSGLPFVFTILNRELFIFPAPTGSQTAQHIYYARITPLDDGDNTTNWLLTSHPDIYLFGTLLQAEPYLKNDERMAVWAAMFTGASQSLALASERAMRPTGNIHSRKRTFG